MKYDHTKTFTLALALGLTGLASAGTEKMAIEPAPVESNPGDFCEWLQNKPGTIWKDKSNPYLQEIQIDGRLQFQTAYLNGNDVNDNDYSSKFNEFRRARLGVKTKFLQYFYTKVVYDLVDDQRIRPGQGSVNWGYKQFDEAYIGFDLNKALGDTMFDSLEVKFGRQKYVLGYEARESSKEILTVERSALSNKVYGSYRPSGFTIEGETGPWFFQGSIYSSTVDGADNTEFNWYQDAIIYYAAAGYQVNDELSLLIDYSYNAADVTKGDNNLVDYAWASSISAAYDNGSWGAVAEVIYGDNGGARTGNANPDRQGGFGGFIVTPYAWLIKDRLQVVGQYQYQGASDAEGVRVNSRYGRARGTGGLTGADVNSGRGDSHNSFYGGLNYYICGNAAKIQGGIEYQTMDTPVGDFDTVTYLLAFRTYF